MLSMMQKYPIILVNVAINLVIMGLLMLMTDGTGRHGYEEAVFFALFFAFALSFQLVINLGMAIYFFVKKDNAKGKTYLLSMAILLVLALIPTYLIGFWDWDL